MKTTLLRTDGTKEILVLHGEDGLNLAEMQKLVGGYVEYVDLPNGDRLIVNEEGKLSGLPVNENATAIFKKLFPIAQYPLNNDEVIVGDALFMERKRKDN